jgi:hypothetical protein
MTQEVSRPAVAVPVQGPVGRPVPERSESGAAKCEHGHQYFCGFCTADAEIKAGRVCKHGTPWFCGWCGPISRLAAKAEGLK